MRAFLAVSLAFVLVACKPPSPPTKEYAYPAWGFRISFPAPPVATPQPASPDGASPSSYTLESQQDGRDFKVWAADVARTGMSLDDLAKSASGFISKQMASTASAPTYAATSEGVMGREYQLTKDGKWAATLRVFLVGGRFYEVIGSSKYGQGDPALQDFLISFHTLGGAPAATNASG